MYAPPTTTVYPRLSISFCNADSMTANKQNVKITFFHVGLPKSLFHLWLPPSEVRSENEMILSMI